MAWTPKGLPHESRLGQRSLDSPTWAFPTLTFPPTSPSFATGWHSASTARWGISSAISTSVWSPPRLNRPPCASSLRAWTTSAGRHPPQQTCQRTTAPPTSPIRPRARLSQDGSPSSGTARAQDRCRSPRPLPRLHRQRTSAGETARRKSRPRLDRQETAANRRSRLLVLPRRNLHRPASSALAAKATRRLRQLPRLHQRLPNRRHRRPGVLDAAAASPT